MTAKDAAALLVYRLAYAREETRLDDVVAYCTRAMEEYFGGDAACRVLGKGWGGEEALAIAVFCALRHEGDPAGTLIAAGNIAGAQVGRAAFAARYLKNMEMTDPIESVADTLHEAACLSG